MVVVCVLYVLNSVLLLLSVVCCVMIFVFDIVSVILVCLLVVSVFCCVYVCCNVWVV